MKSQSIIWRDRTQTPEARTASLLAVMTLEEKVAQMGMCDVRKLLRDGQLTDVVMQAKFGPNGIGCVQEARTPARTSAAMLNTLQCYLRDHTRLGIPALVVGSCQHGHYAPDSTVFPQMIGLGSTWNPALVAKTAAVAAREARAHGVAQALDPDLDLGRDPRWGRLESTFGEDPWLVSRLGVAFIRAMQGKGPLVDRRHVLCTAKHFAVHGAPMAGLNLAPTVAGPREIRTLWLPPFEAAVVEAGVHSIMPAYSEIDGIPASTNAFLLRTILREEWGFKGYVFSDYDALCLLQKFHRTARDAADVARQALRAGIDLEAPSVYAYGEALLGLVRRKEIPMDLVDQAAGRVLRAKFIAGLFEHPFTPTSGATYKIHTTANRKLARRAAGESIVLLKNEGPLLPLKRGVRRIAVIGPNANAAQLGDYCMPKNTDVTPLAGLRHAAGKGIKIRYAQGCDLFALSRKGFAEAVTAARTSDVAIVVVGESSLHFGGVGWGSENSPALGGEGSDSHDLALPGVQADLVRAIHATGTPTVVVLMNGRPLAIPWIAETIPAIVEAWYPGEEGGHAIADILFGKVNPSGRLPVSFPRSAGHVPCASPRKPSEGGYYHKSGLPGKPGRDYVFDSPAPLWAFGHGLSYTTFSWSDLKITPAKVSPAGRVRVSVRVKNTGRRSGATVVQLFVRDVISSVTTPTRTLRRFEKISLRPQQSKTVRFELGPADLRLLDEAMKWVVESGTFEVTIGPLTGAFDVKSHKETIWAQNKSKPLQA